MRCRKGAGAIFAAAEGDFGDRLFGRGVDDLQALAVAGVAPLAVDVVLTVGADGWGFGGRCGCGGHATVLLGVIGAWYSPITPQQPPVESQSPAQNGSPQKMGSPSCIDNPPNNSMNPASTASRITPCKSYHHGNAPVARRAEYRLSRKTIDESA